MASFNLPSKLSRRAVLTGAAAVGFSLLHKQASAQAAGWQDSVLRQARSFEALRSLIVTRSGAPLIEEAFSGGSLDRGVNIKSASKTVLSALVGIAIERGELEGVDQPIVPLLGSAVPANADPRLAEVTIGNLLSMQSGLERTSGPNYGRWVSSRSWVRAALDQPFVDEPGGRMLYSTGNTHLLSAILTRITGRSTLQLARDWLGEPLDITIPPWPTDPQGIYFGGNDMVLSPRALLAFGEMYCNNGKAGDVRVVSPAWIERSWTARTSSPWTGHQYGYGWFLREVDRMPVRYAWGYGGQMLFVAPQAGVMCVMISDPTAPSGRNGYVDQLHQLFDGILRGATSAA
ncbi:serine hydrolase domain-containing protein [Tianweitania sediminis]|uniref:Serine hydrolase n=1 Tax=Tianweitania sediminis TaxID=1502156 RepID=A0A8J7R1E4_9HYPH|nr:serine hydrolase [Tianweitania sediminis]MBP0438823.1 serine hydrolase [Tianweitania sediminis]